MTVVVIAPPGQVVTAAQAKAVRIFEDDDADDYVNTLLTIAQAQIDGPQGWLGRAIGLQTLDAAFPECVDWTTPKLPYPPYVDTISNTLSDDGCTRTVRYRAGYGDPPASPIPAPIKHAIILMAGVLRDATPANEGLLKRVHVEGVGIQEYAVPADAATDMRSAAEALLAPYRVFSA